MGTVHHFEVGKVRRMQQRKQRKWPVREEENMRKRCLESQVEEGFKTEGVFNSVKIG